jgi:hypothetical protein
MLEGWRVGSLDYIQFSKDFRSGSEKSFKKSLHGQVEGFYIFLTFLGFIYNKKYFYSFILLMGYIYRFIVIML